MRLTLSAIVQLKKILLDDYGIDLSDEEAQQTGLKIIRYVYAKELRKERKTVQTKIRGL